MGPAMKATDIQIFAKALVIAMLALVDTFWIMASDFTIRVESAITALVMIGLLLGLGQFYRHFRDPQDRKIGIVCEEIAALVAFSLAAAIFSYLVLSTGRPPIDSYLLAIDAALGFDWEGYVDYVIHHPVFGPLSMVAYMSSLAQVTVLVIWSSFTGRTALTQRFMASIMLGALSCIVISGLLPSAGAVGTIQPPDSFFVTRQPFVNVDYMETYFQLRDGGARVLDFATLKGMISFPSYHGTLSVLIMLAFLSARRFVVPAFILNALVLLATPVDGGHHMSDVLAGVSIAVFCWYLAGVFCAWTEKLAQEAAAVASTAGTPACADA